MSTKKISILVITYNRPDDTLALLHNLQSLRHTPTLLAEIVLVNNYSTADYTKVEDWLQTTQLPVKYIQAKENLGVTNGRNLGMQYVTGHYTVFLDDDAELEGTDALQKITDAFEGAQLLGRPLALLSFKVLYYSTKQLQLSAFPHKNWRKFCNTKSFATYYFAGGAHAVQTQLLKDIGGLPTQFFYGMEEYDISYRLIEKGYAIAYEAGVVMLHKESPLGRQPKAIQWQYMWINKTTVAFTYLPWRYVVSTAVCWSIQYLIKSGGNISGFFKGWKGIFQRVKNTQRIPISKASLQYLRQCEARLWY